MSHLCCVIPGGGAAGAGGGDVGEERRHGAPLLLPGKGTRLPPLPLGLGGGGGGGPVDLGSGGGGSGGRVGGGARRAAPAPAAAAPGGLLLELLEHLLHGVAEFAKVMLGKCQAEARFPLPASRPRPVCVPSLKSHDFFQLFNLILEFW